MKFSIKDFFSKCDQIRSWIRIWSYLLKKCLIENYIFCAVYNSNSKSHSFFTTTANLWKFRCSMFHQNLLQFFTLGYHRKVHKPFWASDGNLFLFFVRNSWLLLKKMNFYTFPARIFDPNGRKTTRFFL